MADLAEYGPKELLALRLRWQRRARQDGDGLRVAFLANYTIDPIVPYLGTALAGESAPRLFVGPVDQIMQQCLDDSGPTRCFEPDVLVVAPRLAEYPVDGADRVVAEVRAAAAAADRWNCCLLVVLTEVPESRPSGVGDDALPGGAVGAAERMRAQVRGLVAGRPNAYLVDVEQVVRAVGAARAYATGLYGYARIPYTEEVFARLADRAHRVLLAREGRVCRAVAVAADSVPAGFWPDVVDVLGELSRAGIGISVHAADAGEFWAGLDARCSEVLDELAGAYAFGGTLADRLPGLARACRVPGVPHVLRFDGKPGSDGVPTVALGADPGRWGAELRAAGGFDRVRVTADPEPRVDGPGPAAAPTLASYVEQLNVTVTCRPLTVADVPVAAEILQRANDFTIEARLSAEELTRLLTEPETTVLVADVRDRLGDYGPSAVLGLTFAGDRCLLHVFSVSCPVLGKGVEDLLLSQAAGLAAEHGCTRLIVPFTDTGRNEVAVRFLAASGGEHGGVLVEPSGSAR
jgi:predicted enzyme involved in methoxymalonyl-ACP biosynthesis